ncbi:MAG: hypothetical protein RLZZ210_1155, partial [Pseudomonadota bacterium]
MQMQNLDMNNIQQLIKDDEKYCWHPFTQAQTAPKPLFIHKAKGCYIYDNDNTPYLDAISSWWVNTHGHNHEYIINAIKQQSDNLAHVIFSGITHQPAIKFAKLLAKSLPKGLEHVFYTDNGSTAIEAGLKMAIQYAYNKNKHNKKHTFLAFEGGYHGDTFGAMAVGKTSGFYNPFKQWLFDVDFIEYPCVSLHTNLEELEEFEQSILRNLNNYLEDNHSSIAGFIFEPLIQGASGMNICRASFLDKVISICKEYNIICIADEVMTGFGRTGKLFACEYLKNTPDIICLSKGITGGNLPLGVAVANDKIHNIFLNDDVMHAFLHGHSYTANPIICAAAIANLELFHQNKQSIFNHIEELSKIYNQEITLLEENIRKLNQQNNDNQLKISNPRIIGSICAFDINILHKNH